MANGFSFYEGTTTENTSPRITVRKGGQLVLTRGAVDMLGEGVEHVQVGYNAKTQVVGIRAAGEDAKGRYRLRPQGSNGLHLVTGKRFFAHYGLDVSKARTFDAEKIEDGLVGFTLAGDDTDKADDGETDGETAEGKTDGKAESKPATKKARRQPTEATA
jgi:hypothetical protein